jgi:hypothetical protein
MDGIVTGQIGYALVPMIARGVMLGPEQPVILHMLDIPPAAESLNGVQMELIDAAFPLLKGKPFSFLIKETFCFMHGAYFIYFFCSQCVSCIPMNIFP